MNRNSPFGSPFLLGFDHLEQLIERAAKWARRFHDQRRVRWDLVSTDVLVLHRPEHQFERLHVACRDS